MFNGIVDINSYIDCIKSNTFKELENYSNDFQELHKDDVFHQWSRQFEYPYVFNQIAANIPNNASILDAGSGITFFPYFLKSKFADANIQCCDYEYSLIDVYDMINSQKNDKVTYNSVDLRELENGSYDIIYCVSVLEHTDNYEQILQNFHELLTDNGFLILTFDISLDGKNQIPLSKSKEILLTINKYFDSVYKVRTLDIINSDKMVTTKYVKDKNLAEMPWKFTLKDKLLLNKIPYLTFYCGTFQSRQKIKC